MMRNEGQVQDGKEAGMKDQRYMEDKAEGDRFEVHGCSRELEQQRIEIVARKQGTDLELDV